MNTLEEKIANNIANKLEMVMQKQNTNTLAIAKSLNLDKQILYKIMKRQHVPNINFLGLVASYLECTVSELIDDKIFYDIVIYEKLNFNKKDGIIYKVYFVNNEFNNIYDKNFFGVKESNNINLYYEVNCIESFGVYLTYNAEKLLEETNIISIGLDFIILLKDQKEIRIGYDKVTVFAKYYKTISIIMSEEYSMIKK